MKEKTIAVKSHRLPLDRTVKRLVKDIRELIGLARGQVAHAANAGLTTLYWSVGRRVREDVLGGKRADYGDRIVSEAGKRLSREFGEGFSEKGLRHMMRFAEAFPDEKIVSALRRQLTWTHFRTIIYIDDPLKRDFYAQMCRLEGWSTRVLDKKIGGMLFERTAVSKRPARLLKLELARLRDQDELTPDLVFHDPYLLDFLKLKGAYQEKDVEAAILREMEAFILEMGAGFAFVARQKRIQIGSTDYYLDLLFYHRRLKRLVAIELKLDKFKPEFKGQMELYLRWLEKNERGPDEAAPIGLILCSEKNREEVELLQLDKSGIRVAQYMTELPPRGVLEKKLHAAIIAARARLRAQEESEGRGELASG